MSKYRYKHFTTALLMRDLRFPKKAARPGDQIPSFELVATDGNRLGAIYDPDGVAPEGGVIIRVRKSDSFDPGAMVRACKKSDQWAVFEDNTLEVDGATFGGTELVIDGTFPDWRRVVPGEVSGEQDREHGFNAAYLASFNVTGTAKNGKECPLPSAK